MSRVLVTGATGFLGGRIAEQLLAEGHEVRALVRPSSRRDHLKGVVPVEGSLQDEASLDRALEGCEAVFHAAAVLGFWKGVEREQEESNVLGTRRVCAAALRARVKRLVHTSSVAAVGVPEEGAVADESSPFTAGAARTAYARTKQAAEREVLEAAERGLDAVILNPSVVYGIRPNLHYSSNLFQDLAAGRVPAYPTGGCSWVWGEDAAAGHLLAWRQGRTGRRYILGAENLPYRDFMRAVCGVAGSRPPFLPVPGPAARLAAAVLELRSSLNGRHPMLSSDMARMSTRHLYYDSGRARRELGWTPTPLEEAGRKELQRPCPN